jgi:hypothetical protein
MSSNPTTPEATIKFKTIERTIQLRCATIPPGGVVPRYRVDVGYVVFPLSPDITTVEKTTYRGGEKIHVETLRVEPGKPFYVSAHARGTEVSMKNIGSNVAIFGKMPTDPGDWDWCRN